MKRLPALLFGASLAVAAAGCASPPTAEVDAAKAKVQALAADDSAYAADAYKAAQDAVAQLDAELETQNQSFALSRSYDRVSELATAAGAAADRAVQAANAEKERLRTEAGRVAADAKRALGDATAAIGKAPRAQAETLKTDAAAAEASLAEVDKLIAAGQLKEAQARAQAASQSVSQISTTIQAAETAAMAETEQKSPDRTQVPRAVMADGSRLSAGTYALRVTNDQAPAVAGQPAATGRWIEFVRSGKVAGRALAVVLTPAEVRQVAKGPVPGNNEVRVELLKGEQYVRVWLNQGGTSYLIHMPIA